MRIPHWKKRKIFKRDGKKCLLCGTKKHLTIDHIIPISKGGGDEEDNLQTLCEYHNKFRGNNSTKDYRNYKGLPAVDPYMCER